MSALRELDDGTIQKQCSKCAEWRRIPEGFPLHKPSADGFYSHCNVCAAKRKSAWVKRNPEKAKAIRRRSARKEYAKGGTINTHLD